MPFIKGKSGNPKGRPLGAGDKKYQKVKDTIRESLAEVHEDTILEKLMLIENPKDFIMCYCKLAEYVEPKMRSVEIPQVEEVSNPVIDVIKEIMQNKEDTL